MSEERKPVSWWRRNGTHIAVFAVTIGIIVILILLGIQQKDTLLKLKDNIEGFRNYGYVGIFLMGIAGSASPIWPLPGSWAAFIGGGLGWNLFFIAVAAGTGESIGELSGYALGYGSQPAIANRRWYQRLERWMSRHGAITVFLVAVVPNPGVIKLVNASAGALRFPIWKWFLISWLGKTIKSFGFAVAGAGLFHWLTGII